MLIEQQQTGTKGSFYIKKGEVKLAEMTYTMPSTDKIIIDHTEVSDELRGKNAGYQLVDAAVEYARKKGLKIIPLCPFAHSVFRKKSEYSDILS